MPAVTLAPIASGPMPPRTWADRVRRTAGHPTVGRALFAGARHLPTAPPVPSPLARFLGLPAPVRLFTRAADVAEILARDDDFTIAEVNGARIEAASGPFVLARDAGPDYEREATFLRAVVPASDVARVAALTAELAAAQLASAGPPGPDGTVLLDAVAGYARPVAVELVQRWLGVTSPDPVTLGHWLRALFDSCFVTDDARSRAVTARIAPRFADHLHALIDGARAHGPDTTTVLGRMVDAAGRAPWDRVDDDAIRRNIAGLAVGAADTTAKAVALVLDELVRRPDQLADAGAAHTVGDTDRVLAHVVECLRWNPHQPLLVRHTRRATTIGGRAVPAGTFVAAVTASAAFDPDAVDAPGTYRLDRDPGVVRPFGDGLHECFGRRINEVTLPALVGPVAAAAPRRAGRLVWDGPFPDHLPLALLDPEAAG